MSAPLPPDEASAAERVYRASCAGVVVFLILYVLPLALEGPSLWYLPLERRWVLGLARPPGLVMDWYGRTLLAALAGAVVAGAVASWRAPLRRPRAWAVAMATTLVVALAAYAWTLHHRVLTPPAEPAPGPATSMLHRSMPPCCVAQYRVDQAGRAGL